MLQQLLKGYANRIAAEEPAGFRAGRSTIDQMFVVRQLSEKFYERNRTLYNNFINFKQAFDSVWQRGLWQVSIHYGIPEKLVLLLDDLYSKSLSAIRVDNELSYWFEVTVGGTGMQLVTLYIYIYYEIVHKVHNKKKMKKDKEKIKTQNKNTFKIILNYYIRLS